MLKSLSFFFLSLCFAYGNESCGRKEMEDTICSLCGQRSGSQTTGSGKQIAFYAYMSNNVQIKTLSKHKIFVYDRVETNIGNGYDAKSGKFIAPESGVYVIHSTTVSYDRSYSIIEIVQNDVIKDIALADSYSHGDRDSSSTLTILNLKKGDVVNARVGPTYGGHYLESNIYARMSFSGFKLM
ncbi:complement C1q tumor necrosis factor-related protein 3-like [Saccostrea echinata]|uniref:complement C1q tumor necrosis factor-related protein 3-like n=1 Tax=Saccostrea echinata TaxID=191078 RepID=UPI002A80BB56|nr:complement C1q tumor necrosis factor-related protein 3-like [Saccostrea echinata]